MTEAKFKDIVSTMIEFKQIDPYKAMLDQNYLVNKVNEYVHCANIVREMMHMESID